MKHQGKEVKHSDKLKFNFPFFFLNYLLHYLKGEMTSIQCNMQSYVRYELSGLMKKTKQLCNFFLFIYSMHLCKGMRGEVQRGSFVQRLYS